MPLEEHFFKVKEVASPISLSSSSSSSKTLRDSLDRKPSSSSGSFFVVLGLLLKNELRFFIEPCAGGALFRELFDVDRARGLANSEEDEDEDSEPNNGVDFFLFRRWGGRPVVDAIGEENICVEQNWFRRPKRLCVNEEE